MFMFDFTKLDEYDLIKEDGFKKVYKVDGIYYSINAEKEKKEIKISPTKFITIETFKDTSYVYYPEFIWELNGGELW